jgi:hypothetical protein
MSDGIKHLREDTGEGDGGAQERARQHGGDGHGREGGAGEDSQATGHPDNAG